MYFAMQVRPIIYRNIRIESYDIDDTLIVFTFGFASPGIRQYVLRRKKGSNIILR
jgi:hypothetical protein